MDSDTKEFAKMLAGSLVFGTAKLFGSLVFGYRLPLLFMLVVIGAWLCT